MRRNRREREDERSSEPDMVDGQMLWLLMQRLRRHARNRVGIRPPGRVVLWWGSWEMGNTKEARLVLLRPYTTPSLVTQIYLGVYPSGTVCMTHQ